MKKKIVVIVVVLSILLLLQILYESNNIDNIDQISIGDYFPQKYMIKVFDGGFENSGYVQIIDIIKDDKVQSKELSTGAGMVFIYEKKKDEVKLVYSEQVDIDLLKYNAMELESNMDKTILQGPIKLNQKWVQEGKRIEITDINTRIITPAGSFNAIEITSEYKSGSKTQNYYAKGIGLIMTRSGGIGSTLQFIDYEIDNYRDDDDLWKAIKENIWKKTPYKNVSPTGQEALGV